MESDNAIYEKNKNVNKEKIQFYNFLTYCTKSEISIQEVQLIFYWIGIIECFTFFLSFCLFCSYPKQFWFILFIPKTILEELVFYFSRSKSICRIFNIKTFTKNFRNNFKIRSI